MLSAQPGNGVVKNITRTTTATAKERRKRESRQQRVRREKGLERAEMARGKREEKVKRSVGKVVVGRERGVSFFFLFVLRFFCLVLLFGWGFVGGG